MDLKFQILTSGIPTDIFNKMKDLTIIDFSNNELREVPPNLEFAKGTIVLNLSHNNVENIPNSVCKNLVDLLILDLSNNKIDKLPPEIRRLSILQELKLSNNPLTHFQLYQLPCMNSLRVLHLRNTNRHLDNIPAVLEDLKNLTDVDFAENNLTQIPEALFKLKRLRKLDLSSNSIEKFSLSEGQWEDLVTLNLNYNKLTALPEGLIKCIKLQRLYASYNQLDFHGIPASIGKLVQLIVLHLSHNKLELIPEGVSRCVNLRRLHLDHNQLITLPEGIHLLPELKELMLHENDQLVMPPKPNEMRKKLTFYNIDFSLENQRRLAGRQHSPSSSMSSILSSSAKEKDPIARRKEVIRWRKQQADNMGDASKVIQGMTKIAGASAALQEEREQEKIAQRSALNWKANLEKSRKNIDYSEIFDEDVGQDEGLWVWEIENFYPSLLESQLHGQFYEADCYLEPSGTLKHEIYYWMGEKATLDKGMCAAVHAVGLRNHLNATCRTIREEMNDESEEFIQLFGGEEIFYVEGARTATGFYTTEKPPHATRLYRASVNGTSVEMEPVPVSIESLDSRFVFLLDAGQTLWIWAGWKSRITVANKARLFAERLNKRDRKGKAEIETARGLKAPEEFWQALTGQPNKPNEPIVEHVPLDFVPERKRLYQVNIGMGFIELPQLELPRGVAKQDMLNTKNVYILDCTADIFLWTGKKANRLLKMAGQKLVTELHQMIDRPDYAQIARETEGEESMMFRSKFFGWDDIVPVDYTRTSESVQRVIVRRDNMMKADLSALFLERQPAMSAEESDELAAECNEDLEMIESFVWENRKFVKLPPNEFGTFYTLDCYVFLCRYAVLLDDETEESENEETKKENGEEEPPQADFKCVLYFWQGRDSSNMGWSQFTFQLQPTFEKIFKDKLEVVRMYQQQENHKFLSHFHKKFLIRRGRRGLTKNLGGMWPELFQMRANGSTVCTRTIQIDCIADQLCSGFCHILRIPYKEDRNGQRGIIYVWIAQQSDPHDHETVKMVANEMINRDNESFPVVVIKEGEEPEEFWQGMGGKKKYQTDATFFKFTRLFRCTNEKGYFAVSEKTVDFCQDDLDDDDIMILDNGQDVLLWIGSRASDVEIKLAYKAATVYVAHMKMKQTDLPRTLKLAIKHKESIRFRKCFHAWGKHKVPIGENF
ncbi:hypothetical protein WR25_10798 [Diploscapter pachys]|uniref:Gelsolin-like domain-containing protein n=1 Tax=Diploscapter pachys TaxID=2018661 RepID=A0A2A2JBM5_9BILA|nr:hypothetical protein WR25_10798 [Diploscapter pachys]